MDTDTLTVTLPPEQGVGEDRTREILGFIHGLLLASDQRPTELPALLAELAGAFGGAGAGLSVGAGEAAVKTQVDAQGRPVTGRHYPWEARPEPLEQARRCGSA